MGREDDPPNHDSTTDHGDRHDDEFQDANQEVESPILAHLTKSQAENPACHAEIPAFSSGFLPNYEIRAHSCR